MTQLPDGYPSQWETDALLKDGATVRVRPIRPEDGDRLVRFHNRQSQESIYFRYFRYRPELSDKEVAYFTNVDYEERMAFVALVGDEMVAVSRYEGEGGPAAEVAFFVDDQHHDRGLATLMLEYLAERARDRGITTFTATVLPENYRMLGVFKNAGFNVSTRFEDGAIAVEMSIADGSTAQAAIDAREQRARSSAVARFFRPSSVAVIGASRKSGSAGHEVLKSILDGGYTGRLAAINRRARKDILGAATFKRIGDVPDGAELAIVCIPAEGVFDAVQECGDAGVKAVLVVAAGFTEAGAEGAERLAELVDLVRRCGIRLVGPLSYGLVNTDPDVSLNAHFLPVDIPAGSVGLLSQSGPLGVALLNQFSVENLGVSTFLSVGTRADVSAYDVLQYWLGDERTATVALYLENFGNPRNFVKVARQISAIKPVVAVAPADGNLASVARAGGVVLVDQVADLVDQVQLLSEQPLPGGNRVVIVSNAASVATLARAACQRAGLDVVAPSAITEHGALSGERSVLISDGHTLSIAPDTEPEAFERAVVAAAVSESVDSVFLALVPTLTLPPSELHRIVSDVDRAVDKPVVAVNLVGDLTHAANPPTFAFPEQAANALGRMTTYAAWRRAHTEPVPTYGEELCDPLAEVAEGLLGEDEEREIDLSDEDGGRFFEALGIPVAEAIVVRSTKEATAAAEKLGFPIALKASWRTTRLAGEAGGTVLDIRHRQHLRRAFNRMGGGDDRPMIVQSMQTPGAHVRLRLEQNPAIGSHVFLGIGGLSRSRLPDIAQLVVPADRADLDELLAQPSVQGLFGGVDSEVIRPLCERLSELAACVPDLARVDLNPLLCTDDGVIAVEARATLRRWPANPLAGVRTV